MNQTSKKTIVTVVTGPRSHVLVDIPASGGQTSQAVRVVTTEREVKKRSQQSQTYTVTGSGRDVNRKTQVDPTILAKMCGDGKTAIIIPASYPGLSEISEYEEFESASEISSCSQKTTDV